MSQPDPSDLTDGQWQVMRALLPQRAKRGRRPLCRRLILHAILYVHRTGCQWRALPPDFPKWKRVDTICWRWRRDGVWQRVEEALWRRVRPQSGHQPTPSVAIIDSQSIRTTAGGEQRGYDVGKKDHRPHTALGRRHPGAGVGRRCSRSVLARSRRSLPRVPQAQHLWPLASRLRRQRLWPRRFAGLSPGNLRLAPANRLAACASHRLCSPAQALDHRADVRLAGPVSSTQQGLRADDRIE
jgi:transposase